MAPKLEIFPAEQNELQVDQNLDPLTMDRVWWHQNKFPSQLASQEQLFGDMAKSTQINLLEQACELQNQLGLRRSCHSIRVNVPFFTSREPHYSWQRQTDGSWQKQIDGFKAGSANQDYSKIYYGEIPVILPATEKAMQHQDCKTTLGWQFLGRGCKDSDAEVGKLTSYSGGRAELFNKLSEKYMQPNQGQVGFFFPGFSTNFHDSVVMAAIAQRDWGIPVVLDSWPSRDHKGPIAYNADEWSISTDYRLVTRPVIGEAVRRFGPNSLDLIGFSMGSRPVTSFALDCAAQFRKTGLDSTRLGRVVEAEADQPEIAFQGDLETIAEGAQDVTLYVSDPKAKGSDQALGLSKFYHGGEMPLGLAGPELYRTLPPSINNVRSIVVNALNSPPFYHEDHDQVMASYARFGLAGLADLGLCLEDVTKQNRYFRLHKGKECPLT